MKRYLILLLILAGMASAIQQVYPWAPDITFHSDTLHVTTDEKAWPLGTTTGAYKLEVINPNANYLLVRFDTDASPLQTYIGNWSTGVYEPPFVLGNALDSIFIDGEEACTVYIEWWSVN